MLQETFIALAGRYAAGHQRSHELWQEIVTHYQNRKRHYHNLDHLHHMLEALLPVSDLLSNQDAVLFALYYHDIVYSVTKKDNEEKSAAFAISRLRTLSFTAAGIESCAMKIEATKTHASSQDADTNYFTDADLAVLGQDALLYKDYCKRIRKEYALYPDIIYKPGRKKVLTHFLQMDAIFKTPYFFKKFEDQARQNLQHELDNL